MNDISRVKTNDPGVFLQKVCKKSGVQKNNPHFFYDINGRNKRNAQKGTAIFCGKGILTA